MANEVSITISTHNIHGFNSNSHYLKDRCDKTKNSIFCIQEHWLRPVHKNIKSINQIRVVHPDFDGYGASAMKNVHNVGVSKGRPYGGTAFVFDKDFTPFLRPIIKYENERVTVMELQEIDGSIMIINSYLPFRQNSEDYKVSYLETLGIIKNILDSNPTSRFIILGDFNVNIYNLQLEIAEVVRDFLSEYDLCNSHDYDPSFDSNASFTRSCTKSGSFSILDYIFFSRSLREQVSNCTIVQDGENPSDHVPVQIRLDLVPLRTGGGGRSGHSTGRIDWSALSSDDLQDYENVMDELLDSIIVPSVTLHGDRQCSNHSHHSSIEHYFQSIVDIIAIADSVLPRKSPHGKRGKGFWSESLSRFKLESVNSHRDWEQAGRPPSGPTYERKKSSHYIYKAELRRQKRQDAAEKNEALGKNLLDKDYVSFWKDWKRASQVKSPPVNRIGDAVTEKEISETFLSFFKQIYGAADSDAHRELRQQFMDRFPDYYKSQCNDSISPFFLSWDEMISISGKLKVGKCFNSFVKAEHILNGSPKLMVHLHILFNGFIQHGFVPNQFFHGTITPIVKDSTGDINAASNYRGVTLCAVLSHLFENALRLKFGHYLGSDDLQFGFKPKHSTSHAVHTLKTCINHFTERDSNVYVAFLDFSKAFDTISHSGLFIKLMDRNVPLCFLLVIIYWYMNMYYDCKWGSSCSDHFAVKCGTKQGGILSPDFFSVYIDDLINILRKTGIGCHVIHIFIACILFADDMTLLAPTRSSMQQLLNLCSEYCATFCLKFNVSKTKIMIFGKLCSSTESLPQISLNEEPIDYVMSCRYLGFYIVSSKRFKCSFNQDLCGFYGSVNSILTSSYCPNENVQLQLLYSNCVPKLTYGAAVKDPTASEKQQYNVAINNAVRRIFGFRRWESIRQLREFYGFDSIEIMFLKAKNRFLSSLAIHSNLTLRSLFLLTSVE